MLHIFRRRQISVGDSWRNEIFMDDFFGTAQDVVGCVYTSSIHWFNKISMQVMVRKNRNNAILVIFSRTVQHWLNYPWLILLFLSPIVFFRFLFLITELQALALKWWILTRNLLQHKSWCKYDASCWKPIQNEE